MTQAINKNHRNTEQRQIILEELKKCCSHPTAAELHSIIKKKSPNMGIATVYRNLKFLLDKKMIIKLNSKDREVRYDGKIEKHCHAICRCCNGVMDLMDCEEVNIISSQLRRSGFQIDPSYLEVFGTCKKCQ